MTNYNTDKYLEIPWDDYGSEGSFDGCNCYGLLRLFYKEELGIELPQYIGAGYTKGIDQEELSGKFIQEKAIWWEDVMSPSPGDVVWLRIAGNPYHVGVMVSSERFLHIEEGAGPSLEDITNPRWARRINGYVCWKRK